MADKKRPLIGMTIEIEDNSIKLRREYIERVEEHGGMVFLITPFHRIDENDLSGIIIPGGGDIHPSYYGEEILFDNLNIVNRMRTEFELELLQRLMKLKRPILGICYGMQLINVFMGGTLYQDIKREIPASIDHNKGHHVHIKENRFIKKGIIRVNSSHHQSIKSPGKGIDVIGTSEDGVIEAITHIDYPYLLGLQWHPERMNDEISKSIFRNFIEACNEV